MHCPFWGAGYLKILWGMLVLSKRHLTVTFSPFIKTTQIGSILHVPEMASKCSPKYVSLATAYVYLDDRPWLQEYQHT